MPAILLHAIQAIIITHTSMDKRATEKKVQNIRQLLTMRFRLTHDRALQLRKGKRTFLSSVMDRISGRLTSSQLQNTQSLFCLKFVEKMNEEYLLVGNEYQLNAIGIHCMPDYVEANSQWAIAEEDPITNVFVSPKVRSLFVICQHKLHLYCYVLQACEEAPVKEQTLTFSEPIYGVYVVKRAIVLVLLKTRFEVMEIIESQGKTRLAKRKQLPYMSERRQGLQIISIPQEQGTVLQVFFKDTLGTTIFPIYTLRIECLSCQQVSVGTLHKFCEVPQRYISTLQISHYRSDIFLVYVGLQLYAVRNNYFLDSIITNTSKLRSFIKEFNSNFFFLYHKDRFELYRYQLNEKTTPERFYVQCLDTIPLAKPAGSYFLDIKQLGDHLVFLFQQPRPSDSSELNFWLAVGDQVPISDKIDKLYPSSPAEVDGAEREALQDRIEMALQMGLSLDTAYLQLWQRSGRVSRRDYDLLISTQNYEMIAGEIQNKLKKSSLKFLQLMEVMERSLAMLQKQVRRPQPSHQHLRQLVSCHFLICKYRMFAKVRRASGVAMEQMVINIQDYYHLTRLEIFKYLFELLGAYLTERNKSLILLQIRALLTQFSFIFRLKYHQILPNIVKTFRKDLLKLIKVLPELLPRQIKIDKSDKRDKSDISSGVWQQVDLQGSDDYLILENLANFENRRNIQQFSESKFFKVYQWHSHGSFAESKAALQERMEKWTSQAIFIILYEQLLTLQFKTEQLDELVAFIEANYPLLPPHLHGRFRFYEALYVSFSTFHSAMRKEFMGTGEFLRLREDQLFEIYFQEERAKKGIFLLKEVQPIYEKTVAGGRQLFLSSMFRFFQGNRSSWADLKIVLNKFNNEKQDFHESNYEVFQVMVKAIMEKVRVGSGKEEAGLDEVVSYLQNIPFPLTRTSLLQSLISIQQIRQEEPTLRSINIDMTLRQILENGEEVIYRMVESQMVRYKVHEVLELQELKLFAYKILLEVNYRKSNLYVDEHYNFAFKCFLIILMQDQRHIPTCSELLHDDFLVKIFRVDSKLIENIVIYLYRKRLSINPVYEENKLYIDAIVNILDQQNVKRRFLELSEIYAGMFSSPRYKMKYPFFKTYYPTVDEVSAVIFELHPQDLVLIDHEEVFDLIIEFKALGEDIQNIMETRKNRFANHSGEEKLRVMKHELYTAFFLCFTKHGLIKQRALAIAAQIMDMDTRYKIYNIIVPVFLIEIAQKELIAQLADPLGALVSYYFNYQHQLQAFVNNLFANAEGFTNQQLLEQFTLMRKQKEMEPIFDPNNPVFSAPFLRALQGLSRSEQAARFNPMLQAMWGRLRRCREEFAKVRAYHMMYRLLLHNPYVLAEYINRRKEGINVRSVRAMLSLLGMEGFFDLQKILELGEGIFSILMVELKSKVLLEDLLEMFSSGEKYRDELKHTDEYCAELIKMEAEDLIGNSILSFRAKLAKFATLDKTAFEEDKEKKFAHLMADWEGYYMTYLNYPFQDRDKEYSLPEEDLYLPVKHKRDKKLQFDERKQRSELCEHLNYFVQPAFRRKEEQMQDTLAEFYLKLNKKLVKKHPVRMKSLRKDTPHTHTHTHTHNRLPHAIQPPLRITEDRQFDNLDVEQYQDILHVSHSQKVVADHSQEPSSSSSEEEGLNFGNAFIDFLPEFTEDNEGQLEALHQTAPPSAVQQEIEECLKGKPHFDPTTLPQSLNKQQFLQKTVGQVYSKEQYPLLRRIQVIWDIKRALFDKQQWQQPVQQLTLRLGKCSLVHSLLTKIQDIFTPIIFLQQFPPDALLQLVRQNASEAIKHQQDMSKVAEIIRVAFASASAWQSVLMMFLIRLCRSYSLTQDQREQNHLKDEIIFLQQSIDHRMLAEAAENYSRSRNEDLRTTGHVLQFFRAYKNHHGNASHIRISAIPSDL